METPETIRTSLQQGEWVTSVDFKDAYFHIPIQDQSRKYLRFHVQGQTYQFRALPFGLSTAPMEFTILVKEVKLMAMRRGIRIHQYLDDWLVRANSYPICRQHTQILVQMCQELGWLVNTEKSELEPKQVFNFVGYQFDLRTGWVRPTPDRWENLQEKIQALLSLPACPVRQFMSLIGLLTATKKQVHLGRLHSVAPQKQLEGTGISRKDYPSAQVPAPTLAMVVTGGQCSPRPTFTPNKACSADLYRRIKRRLGHSLKRAHCKRVLVDTGKQTAHQLSRAKSSLASLKRVSGSLRRQNRLGSYRQHHSGSVHKQGRRHEVGSPVCPPLEDIDLVLPETSDSQSPAYSRPSKCDSGQAIQTGSDYPNRVVPPSGSISRTMQQVAPAPHRSVCHKVQSQTASLCIPSFGLPSFCSRCTHSAMGGSGCICFPTNPHLGQGGGKVTGLSMQETNPDCARMAQHALVLGFSGHVQSSPPQTSKSAQSADTALQSDPSQKSDKPEPSCMAPRASAIRKQGFSEAVATRIEAPQRRSTRSVYEAKWSIFTKWCIANQVDFKSPPLKLVADFLLYLFEVKNLQPSTIDGYRSAIADKLGNITLMSVRMRTSPVSWTVSIETDPKGGEAYPPGTFPWCYTS